MTDTTCWPYSGCGTDVATCWERCGMYRVLRALPRAHIYDDDVRGICAVNDADNDATRAADDETRHGTNGGKHNGND